MRNIKFRVFVKAHNQMFYPVDIANDIQTENHDGNKILMQFTGLHDKNGKEIFEGDIIQSAYEDESPEEDARGIVEYGRFNCSCCGGVYGWSISNDKADLRHAGQPDNDPSLTVIGNIYENPELLTK